MYCYVSFLHNKPLNNNNDTGNSRLFCILNPKPNVQDFAMAETNFIPLVV